jgi:hypothetical protein
VHLRYFYKPYKEFKFLFVIKHLGISFEDPGGFTRFISAAAEATCSDVINPGNTIDPLPSLWSVNIAIIAPFNSPGMLY